MCTKSQLNEVLKRLHKDAKGLFGDKLKEMILYGSYARGTNNEESDIDVMLIVDIPIEDELASAMLLADAVVDLNLEFDVVISPLVESREKYEKYKNVNPLFINVKREGVRIAA